MTTITEHNQAGEAVLAISPPEIGRRLVRQGSLADANDVFLLYLAEIRAGLADVNQQSLAAQRQAEMAAWSKIIGPSMIWPTAATRRRSL